MVEIKSTGYKRVEDLQEDINNIEKKMENIGNDNIISHSTIDEIEQDINNVSTNINNTKRKNRRKTCIKNIKIFGRIVQAVFPYVLAASIVFGIQVAVYDVPFIRQKQFKIARHDQTINQSGIVDDEITRILDSDKKSPRIFYNTKWEKREDGKYYRSIKEYYVDKYSTEELLAMLNDPAFDFEKAFGDATTKFEVRDEKNITQEEIEASNEFKIVYQFSDDEDVVLIAQDVWPNIWQSFMYILFVSFFELFALAWRNGEFEIQKSFNYNYDFGKFIANIKKKNKTIDISEVEKLFNEKKIRFEVVKHQQVTLTDPIDNKKSIIKIKK